MALFHIAHYNIIAKQLRDMHVQLDSLKKVDDVDIAVIGFGRSVLNRLTESFANRLEKDNPSFDREKFMLHSKT